MAKLNISLDNLTSTEKGEHFQDFLNNSFDGLNPADIVFLMTLPNPDSAVTAQATVSGKSQPLPIDGEIGYCFEFSAAASGLLHCMNSLKIINDLIVVGYFLLHLGAKSKTWLEVSVNKNLSR